MKRFSIFWKKKPSKGFNEGKIIGELLQDFFDSDDFEPLYVHSLKCEADVNGQWDNLPAIFVWNERLEHDVLHFTVSVNKPMIGALLEVKLSRNNPSFIVSVKGTPSLR